MIRIESNRFVNANYIFKLSGRYRGRGRPRLGDYALDIAPKIRKQLRNKSKKLIVVKSKVGVGRRIAQLFILAGVLFVLGLEVKAMQEPFTSPIERKANAETIKPQLTQVEEIKRELAIKFGFDAPIAWGVMRAESNRNWVSGDELVTNSIYRTKWECSIGLFQINVASDFCVGDYIHGWKVPGDSVLQKMEWLKSPINNIEIAHQIWEKQGFTAWSVYNDGRYKQYVGEY